MNFLCGQQSSGHNFEHPFDPFVLKHVRQPLRGSLVDAVKWLNLRCRSSYTQSLLIFAIDIVPPKRDF